MRVRYCPIPVHMCHVISAVLMDPTMVIGTHVNITLIFRSSSDI